MTMVDSSVWIDLFRGRDTPEVGRLGNIVGTEVVVVGDLVLVEVLQGCATEREFQSVRRRFQAFGVVNLVGADVAVQAARNYRQLRSLGITARKTIDTLIATWCILHDVELLHADRDFEPFAEHLGLRCVDCGA